MMYDQQYFVKVEQIIPPPALEDYFVEVANVTSRVKPRSRQRQKQLLPRMDKLFEWGLVQEGDKLHIRTHDSDEAEAVDPNYVKYRGQQVKYNDWGKMITGWPTINIYEWTIHNKSDKSLDVLRREKMDDITNTSTAQN